MVIAVVVDKMSMVVKYLTASMIGVIVCFERHSLAAHLRRLGRNRKEGKRPQRKPPTCEMCDVPVGVDATVAMKKHRKASIMTARMIGLQHHGQASHAQ